MTFRLIVASAIVALASRQATAQAPALPPPPAFEQPAGAAGPPLVITRLDALDRARANDASFLSAVADASLADQDRAQAKAGLLPAFSHTTQYLGTKGDTPLPSGRFVGNDGVHLYRSWLVAHEDLSPNLLTPVRRATAAQALAEARLEIARRGLTLTVTERYYALVGAERKYAAAQEAAQQAQRFLDLAQRQERLGQVARADVIKADIQFRQQNQAFQDANLQMQNSRMQLAVLLFPTFNQQFTVVDDLNAAPALPAFPEARAMAERENPDLLAAGAALRVVQQDVTAAKWAFLPTLSIDADYGIEANEFALHSVADAEPDLGVVPNLGYFVTLNVSVPLWDWGGMRSKLRQTRIREGQARAELTQTQRELVSNLYQRYNEAVAARAATTATQEIADLAAESLRLINLRYQAGESSALEVVDAQNTLIQSRDAYDAALVRYRIALVTLQTMTGVF